VDLAELVKLEEVGLNGAVLVAVDAEMTERLAPKKAALQGTAVAAAHLEDQSTPRITASTARAAAQAVTMME
jgi:hypothetical protein